MHTIQPSSLLKFAFAADAAISGAVALLQLLFPDELTRLLVLPRIVLVESGVFLIGYALLLAVLARSRALPRALVLALIFGNIGWAAGCAYLAAASEASALGIGFVLIQAVTVLAFAALQWAGLARSAAAPRLQTQVAK